MNIFTSLRLSAIVLLSFLFTTSYAQKEEDYFITVWDLSLDKNSNTSIEFSTLTTGDVIYTWETIPAGQSGRGEIIVSGIQVSISNLPIGKTIKLKLAPQNLKGFYSNYRDNFKLIDVKQWGKAVWSSLEGAFVKSRNLNISATDLPNLTLVKSLNRMFYQCFKLNGPSNINQWNTQNILDMAYMFAYTESFNQPIGDWNTQNVINMEGMFREAKSFNQPIGNWNTQSAINMENMFENGKLFNQPIGNWNTQNVINTTGMFALAKSFNQPIGNWNTENVLNMNGMFMYAESFNQPIGNWNTQNVIDMNGMFYNASSFNQPIGNWNTSKVTQMNGMFREAKSFNQPIGNWNTQNVTNMEGMFYNAKSFNQPIGNWDTQNVTSMSEMFRNALTFNQPIGKWNTKNVAFMDGMFYGVKSFNQRLDSLTLNQAVHFGGFLATIDFTTSIYLLFMLDSCGMDCENYSNTLIGWANNPNTPTNKEFGAAGLKYTCLAQAARDILTKPVAQGGKGWTIYGDALSTEDCGLITAEEEGVDKPVLSIYPNPAQDKLFLKNAITNTAYKIIDGLGREVNAGTCENEEISIATLPSGLYTLRCGNRYFTFVKE